MAFPLSDISATMIDKLVDARLELEKADGSLNKFLPCQDSNEGKATKLPKI